MGGAAVPSWPGRSPGAGASGCCVSSPARQRPDRMTRALHLAGGGAVGMGVSATGSATTWAPSRRPAAWLRVVEAFWTDPDAALVQRARQAGLALVAWQARFTGRRACGGGCGSRLRGRAGSRGGRRRPRKQSRLRRGSRWLAPARNIDPGGRSLAVATAKHVEAVITAGSCRRESRNPLRGYHRVRGASGVR